MTDQQTKLIEDNIKLSYYAANKFRKYVDNDLDEAISVANLGLCKAAMSFDLSCNTKFSTYAIKVILNEFRQCYRYQSSQTARYGIIASLDEPAHSDCDDDGSTISLLDQICCKSDCISYSELIIMLQEFMNTRSDIDKCILNWTVCQGMTQTAIADQLNMSKAAVNNRLRRMRKLIKDKYYKFNR